MYNESSQKKQVSICTYRGIVPIKHTAFLKNLSVCLHTGSLKLRFVDNYTSVLFLENASINENFRKFESFQLKDSGTLKPCIEIWFFSVLNYLDNGNLNSKIQSLVAAQSCIKYLDSQTEFLKKI